MACLGFFCAYRGFHPPPGPLKGGRRKATQNLGPIGSRPVGQRPVGVPLLRGCPKDGGVKNLGSPSRSLAVPQSRSPIIFESLHHQSLNNPNGGMYNQNTITAEDWANTLEANGAVFLPAAGFRSGTTTQVVCSSGYYWSSSYEGTDYAYYGVSFDFPYLYVYNTSTYRYRGCSVRLVHSVGFVNNRVFRLILP